MEKKQNTTHEKNDAIAALITQFATWEAFAKLGLPGYDEAKFNALKGIAEKASPELATKGIADKITARLSRDGGTKKNTLEAIRKDATILAEYYTAKEALKKYIESGKAIKEAYAKASGARSESVSANLAKITAKEVLSPEEFAKYTFALAPVKGEDGKVTGFKPVVRLPRAQKGNGNGNGNHWNYVALAPNGKRIVGSYAEVAKDPDYIEAAFAVDFAYNNDSRMGQNIAAKGKVVLQSQSKREEMKGAWTITREIKNGNGNGSSTLDDVAKAVGIK